MAKLGFKRVPIDVKKIGMFRSLAILENVLPPGIVALTHTHVIGDHIEDLPHAEMPQFFDEAMEVLFAAYFWIQQVVVSDVVAVNAARTGLQYGRRIDVRNAQLRQIFNQLTRILKTKTLVKL